jgi:hypothetical protein
MSDTPAISVLFGVSLTTDQLTIGELATLVNAINFDGIDLKQLEFYEKIKPLLVSAGDDTLHRDVKEAIIILAGRRLQG